MKFFKPVLVVSTLIVVATIALAISPKNGKTNKRSAGKALSDEDKWVNDKLSKMTLEEKIGQSFMVACWSNRGSEHIEEIEKQITDDHIGGVIFFQGERGNLQNSIDRFQKKAGIPLLIGMDAEWGIAMRIFEEERFPYAQTIGAANDTELTRKMGEYMAVECDQTNAVEEIQG